MIKVEIEGAEQLLNLLRTLPRHLTADKKGGPVAKSVRKGGNLMRQRLRVALRRSIELRGDESTGLLLKNLKVRRKRYAGKGEMVSIGVGNKRYPVKGQFVTDKKGRLRQASMAGAKTTRLSGQRLEYGTSKQAPAPWVRPTFAASAEEVMSAVVDDLKQRLDAIAQQQLKG